MNKITPYLWFNNNALKAAEFYLKIFKDAALTEVKNGPDGTFFAGTLELSGQKYILFNGGDYFKLNPSFSLYVDCETQEEVDYYWDEFINDGAVPSRCGWLVDAYGVSWQIIPKMLPQLLFSEHGDKARDAMLKMSKIIIKDIEEAVKK